MTAISDLPSDVLAIISSNLPLNEILRLCHLNRKMNAAICRSDVFWRNLSRQRHLTYQSVREVQKALFREEKKPRLFELEEFDVGPGKTYRDVTKLLKELNNRQHRPEWHPRDPDRLDKLVSEKQIATQLADSLRDFDVLSLGDKVYLVRRYLTTNGNRTGYFSAEEIRPGPPNSIHLSDRQLDLLGYLYKLNNGRPLTLQAFNELFPNLYGPYDTVFLHEMITIADSILGSEEDRVADFGPYKIRYRNIEQRDGDEDNDEI